MPTGTKDTERRERIARAAIDVVARSGVAGLTHRAVASAASVPLGSTTYYFDTLDDLLAAAVTVAMAETSERLAAWDESLGADPDLVAALSLFLAEVTGPLRELTIVEYELYLAALRRPGLEHLSREWARALHSVLIRRIDPLTADALAVAADGLAMQSLIRGFPLTMSEIEPILRRIVA